MTHISLRWKLILVLVAVASVWLAYMLFKTLGAGDRGSNIIPITLLLVFAVVIGVLPWTGLRRSLVRRLAALILVIPLWSIAYPMLSGGVLDANVGETDRLMGYLVGGFLGLLGLVLAAQALGLIHPSVHLRQSAPDSYGDSMPHISAFSTASPFTSEHDPRR